jgi:hypothetical protein
MIGEIGAAISAVGSLASAYGASQNAKAMQAAYKKAAKRENQLFDRQTKKLDTLIDDKEGKLYNLGDIFDRFESTGAFGDTETLKNLRQAQSDFSALAAGDFTAFESQLRKSMSDALINTVGSGSPIGAYAGLAADQQIQYRLQGVQTGMGITEFLSNESNKLLGMEFGIMDQQFNNQYQLDRTKVTNVNNYSLGQAGQAGVGTTAFGNALTQGGSLLNSYGQFQSNLASQNRGFDLAQQQIGLMEFSQNGYAPRAINIGTQLPFNPATRAASAPGGGGPSWQNFDDSTLGPLPSNNNFYQPSTFMDEYNSFPASRYSPLSSLYSAGAQISGALF